MAGRQWIYGAGVRALVVRLLLVSALLSLMPGSAVSWFPGTTYAATSYYVDCSARTSGNGSQTSPWNNLVSANSTVFAPGDQILLKRGTRCVGELDLQG